MIGVTESICSVWPFVAALPSVVDRAVSTKCQGHNSDEYLISKFVIIIHLAIHVRACGCKFY